MPGTSCAVMAPRYHGYSCVRNYSRDGRVHLLSQPLHDLVDDPLAVERIEVGYVAYGRVDPALRRRELLEERGRGGRHEAVVAAVNHQRGHREAAFLDQARVDAIHGLEEVAAQARCRPANCKGVGLRDDRWLGVARDLLGVPGVRDGEGRAHAREDRGESPQAGVAASERRRRQDRDVRSGPIREQVVGHDERAVRVRVDRRRQAVGPAGIQPVLHVVEQVVPLVDIGAPAARGSEAAVVVGGGDQPGGGEPPPGRVVAPGVLAQPVDDEDGAPRIAGRRPPARQEWRPVARGDGLDL